ncbi:MAG TPA: hypothetical protein VK826_19050 [Bacteroidia bacterium]|nr:hypothetical protein [Bacteroidia bacterium]
MRRKAESLAITRFSVAIRASERKDEFIQAITPKTKIIAVRTILLREKPAETVLLLFIFRMRLADKAKYNAIYYLVLSIGLAWGYNVLYLLYKGFSPLESAILHMLCSLISVTLAWMAIQLFRKSSPSGSNLGCVFLVLVILNFVRAVISIFAALIHLFGANGGQLESIWLM